MMSSLMCPACMAQRLQVKLDMEGGMHDARLDSTREIQSLARQITVRCLRRWDGLLGIRAGSDGLGRRSGIWRDKFDGVRYGVLLLAMRKLNADLLSSSTQPSLKSSAGNSFGACSFHTDILAAAAG
ncbi:hypothetical protein WJX77_007596 [Trebouxia sp. C0004]